MNNGLGKKLSILIMFVSSVSFAQENSCNQIFESKSSSATPAKCLVSFAQIKNGELTIRFSYKSKELNPCFNLSYIENGKEVDLFLVRDKEDEVKTGAEIFQELKFDLTSSLIKNKKEVAILNLVLHDGETKQLNHE